MKTKLLLGLAFLLFQFSPAKTLTVVDPVAPSISPFTICDGNNDGFEVFDLIALSPQIIAEQSDVASNYVVAYYENLANAQIGANSILGPYYNINPNTQTVYYRVTNITTSNYAVGSIQLIVNSGPVATFPPDLSMCDSNNDGIELFDFSSQVPIVLGAVNPATATVSFYTSQASANARTSPIFPINLYVGTNGQTIWVRVEDNATGCYDLVSFHLGVNPLPQSTQPNYPQYALCNATASIGYETFDLSSRVSSILLGQTGMNVSFYPSLIAAQNNTNVITNPSAYVNQIIYVQTLGIRITNQVTGCYAISTMDIMVLSSPNLVPPSTPYTICDSDNDGYGLFDFTPLLPELLQGSNYIITYHETLADAEAGVSDLGTPIQNSIPFNQTFYLRAQDPLTGCFSVLPVTLNVHASPEINTPSANEVCSTSDTTLFDLTTKIPEILGSLNPANFTVSFYHTLAEAEQAVNPITEVTNYSGGFGELLSVRVEDNASHCTSFVYSHLIITTPLVLTTPTVLSVCDNDSTLNNQYTHFDLTVKNSEIIQGLTGYTVTYFPSLANAQTGTNAIASPISYVNSQPTIQTLGVRVTSPTGCISLTTLDIRVLPVPAPYTNPNPIAVCDTDGDGFETVDLTVNSAYIINGDPNLVLHFYPTMADALANVNQILTPSAAVVGGNVWIRVENNMIDFQGNRCYVLAEQPIIINSLPNINLVSNNTLNTVYVDGLNNVVQSLILDAQHAGNYAFTWEVDGTPIPGAISSVYTVNTASPTGNSRTFVVSVTNLITGCANVSSIVVTQSSGTPSPRGAIMQLYNPGDTLADLSVTGVDILWYADASGKNATTTNSTPLPLSTLLQNATTYYASQSIGGFESIARLPVTVYAALGVPENDITSLQFAPNPLKEYLTLHSSVVIKSISVYTILGQQVFEQNYNDTNISIDLSILTKGNYILKAQCETGYKTIRIIKE
jgi:hypothetical protein